MGALETWKTFAETSNRARHREEPRIDSRAGEMRLQGVRHGGGPLGGWKSHRRTRIHSRLTADLLLAEQPKSFRVRLVIVIFLEQTMEWRARLGHLREQGRARSEFEHIRKTENLLRGPALQL